MTDAQPAGGLPPSGRSAELARQVAPERVGAGAEREITVDRSNHCVVVDEAVFVKWLTPPVPVPHPGLTVLSHLAEVGFTAMPALLGAQVADGVVRAIVFEHVHGADDGWEWLFNEVLESTDGAAGQAAVIASATAIGSLAADLHAALATPSSVFPEPVTTVDAGVQRERGRTLLAAALDEVTAAGQPEAHAVLSSCHAQLVELIESIPDGPTTAIVIHGDLHVGQVLRSGQRLVLIDFDGNPLLASTGAPARQPAALDIAALAQSVDHAVRMAQHRRPGRDVELDALAADASGAVLDSYCRSLGGVGLIDLLDARLLTPMRAVQELHELVYSVRRLPRWAYAPTLALQGMLLRSKAS